MAGKFTLWAPAACAVLLFSSQAEAAVYACIQGGETVYTSNPKGSCSSVSLPKLGNYSNSRSSYREPVVRSRARPAAQATPVSAKGPVPQVSVIPKGSSSRRAILEQELSNERKALDSARAELGRSRSIKGGDYGKYQTDVRRLESAVADRQQNIQALQRELGRM